MWVARIPQRSDFCGCPPCPLCFDWSNGGSMRIHGMDKFIGDLLEGKKPTKKQSDDLKKAADAIHIGNLQKVAPVNVDDAAAAFDRADDEQFMRRRLKAVAKERALEAARPKVTRLPVLDHIELEKPKKKEKKPEKREAPAMPEMDYGQYQQSRQMEEIRQMQERMYAENRRMQSMMYERMDPYSGRFR